MTPPPWEAPLRRYPAPLRPLRPPEPLGNAGGLSGARLWRYPSAIGPLGLRLWPVDGLDRRGLEVVHGWIAMARHLGFVPVPLASTDGRTLIEAGGRLWEVAPWMPGQADHGRPPNLPRVHAMFAALAKFHRALGSSPSTGPSPGLATRLVEVERWLRSDLDALASVVLRTPSDPHAALATRWLAQARALAPGLVEPIRRSLAQPLPLQPCLRDARADHFLFEGDRLAALVDFGAMGVDTVAADLARLLADAVGPDRPARVEALAAYSEVRPLTSSENLAIVTFEWAGALLIPGRWLRWLFLEARTFDDPTAIASGLRRGLDRLGERYPFP